MTSFEVRQAFLKFFTSRGHQIVPGSSLLRGKEDPSLLFVNAGMNQFKEVFLGLKPSPYTNVVTVQQCLRAGGKHNDLEMVGETPLHHTFFEMLGNFSFGGYFKEQAIALAWEFLTKELGLKQEHLWITVHKQDAESYHIWRDKQKIPEHKIYKLGDEDNFWKMGETGPCGYCSEIHYYKGQEKNPDPKNFMEIWNLVFMEFNDLGPEKPLKLEQTLDSKQKLDSKQSLNPEQTLDLEQANTSKKSKGQGKREKLKVPCVDTGMGLERLCALLQGEQSNYHSDIFRPLILELQKASTCQYNFEDVPRIRGATKRGQGLKTNTAQAEQQKAFRVLVDHSRAVVFLIHEGLLPASSGAEYVLRRIMRRAFYHSRKLSQDQNLLLVGAKKLIALLSQTPPPFLDKTFTDQDIADKNFSKPAGTKKNLGIYPDLQKDEKEILSTITSEYQQFLDMIREGEKEWEKLRKFKESKGEKTIKAPELWNLYSTYGLPLELSQLKFKDWGWEVAGDKEIEKHKNQMAIALDQGSFEIQWETQKNQILKIGLSSLNPTERKTQWTAYEQNTMEAQILGLAFFFQDSHSVTQDKTGTKKDFSSAKTSGSCSSQDSTIRNIPLSPFYGSFGDPIKEGSKAFIVMDKTCFYPEGGGPIGDKGWLLDPQNGQPIAQVLDCQKVGETIYHEVQFVRSLDPIQKGQKVRMAVDQDFREGIKSAHTATHLLNSALRQVLGMGVRQAGSLVEPYRLRFDFTYPRPLTKKQIQDIEGQVWKSLLAKEELTAKVQTFDQAEKQGALFLKGEKKYGEKVRVISIGDKTSKELCGGLHVWNTQEIEKFQILLETGVQSGVRRIVAYTGPLAKAWEELLTKQNLNLRQYLNQQTVNNTDSPDMKRAHGKASDRKLQTLNNTYPPDKGGQGGSKTQKIKAYFLTDLFNRVKYKKETKELKNKKSESLNSSNINKTFDVTKQSLKTKEVFKKENSLWKGLIETQNPFLKHLEDQDKELKNLRQKIVRLEENPAKQSKTKPALPQTGRSPLARCNTQEEGNKTNPALNKIVSPQSTQKPNPSLNKLVAQDIQSPLKKVSSFLHPLAQQMLELREDLKLPLPKEKSAKTFWDKKIKKESKEAQKAFDDTEEQSHLLLKVFEDKEQKIQQLSRQWDKIQKLNLTKESLLSRAKEFQTHELKAKLLIVQFPLEDRKILSDLSDFLLSQLAPGIVILLGEGESKSPLLVNTSKELTKVISANDILKKTILPLCEGQGGGRPHFAQGSINKPSAFTKVEPALLKKLSVLK